MSDMRTAAEEYEQRLRKGIHDLELDFRRRAQPLVAELARIESFKPPPPLVVGGPDPVGSLMREAERWVDGDWPQWARRVRDEGYRRRLHGGAIHAAIVDRLAQGWEPPQ